MSNEYKSQIYSALAKFAVMFDQEITAERIQAYTEELADYPPEAVIKAIKTLKRTSRRYPPLCDFIELIEPKIATRDEGVMVANKIIEAVKKFGWIRTQEAAEHLGDIAWSAVQGAGGWTTVCQCPIDDLGILRAQLRDSVVSLNGFKNRDTALQLLGTGYHGQELMDKTLKTLEGK